MAAPIPPNNQAGVPLPPNPHDPVIHDDIAQAHNYLQALAWTRAGPHQNPATDQEIALAEVYKSTLVFSCAPAAAAPPWLAAIHADIQHMTNNIATLSNNINQLLQKSDEQPKLLVNSSAGICEPLYDPTQPGWIYLNAPNPTTCRELAHFNRQQCADSAAALDLPVLPAGSSLRQHRQQIAVRIGVIV
ncbi:hypothetical protein BYT27DRAFT_7263300 [Phlegmacium glaucopus]|nr:hypothetical protein BYT27DRAFT_7263300 [Phlegmacium glaucopus]